MKRRIRRKSRNTAPPVRRGQDPRAASREGALMVGGALDPAEKSADRMAAKVLSGGFVTGGTAPSAGPPPVHRQTVAGPAIAGGGASVAAPAGVVRDVAGLGPGRALSAGERGFFEPRFGADFGEVRVHDGADGDRATRQLDARAFAHGPDIAFAAGQATPATMAHELAHVAQDQAGGPLRRKITAGTAKQDFTPFLSNGYSVGVGAGPLKKSGNAYSATGFKTSGPLDQQIAQNLVASERLFKVDGTADQDIQDNFDQQVFARQDIVDFAKAWRVAFKAATPKVPAKYLDMTVNEATRRVKNIEANLTAKGKKPAEIKAIIRSIDGPLLHEVFRDIVGTVEFETIMQEFRDKSAQFDKDKAAGKSPAYEFEMACQFATMTVMYGASRSAIDQQNIKGPGVTGTSAKDMASAVWTDWVPGDWGYIKNTGSKTPALGLEGENLISIGDDKFWAHFDPTQPIQTLQALFDMVKGWDTAATLQPTRRFPIAGLKK